MMTGLTEEPLTYRLRYGVRLLMLGLTGAAMYPLVVADTVFRAAFRMRRGPRAKANDIAQDLAGIELVGITPSEAARVRPSVFSTALSFLPDLVSYAAELGPRGGQWLCPLPPCFVETEVSVVKDALRLACTVGHHPDGRRRPVVVLLPGMFNTRHQNVMLRMARYVFFAMDCDVVIADMRGFGRTYSLNPVPPSGSWLEAQDVLALTDWIRVQLRSTGVFVTGFSYGGAIALAVAAAARDGQINGSLASCPFGDLGRMLDRLSQPVALTEPAAMLLVFYRWLLLRMCRRQGHPSIRMFSEYFETVVVPFYRLPTEELYRERPADPSCPELIGP